MNLNEAKRVLGSVGFSVVRKPGSRLAEARSFNRKVKEDAARRVIEEFPDWSYADGKVPLTDAEMARAKELAGDFTIQDLSAWANNRGKDLFDRKERETLYYLAKSYWQKQIDDYNAAEQRRYNQATYDRYKKCQEIWPEFKENVVDRLKSCGYEVIKIEYAGRYHDFNELMRNLQKRLPGAEPLDGKIPYKITMRAENSTDSFQFETDIDLDRAHIGNTDAIRILADESDGKAKACIALEKYRDEHHNTWDIPMDIFLAAAEEFANADEFLDDDEAAAVKRSAASNDAFQAGASEFYRTARYQGD